MADDEDVLKALEFLRKHDLSHTGAPVVSLSAMTTLDADGGLHIDGGMDDFDMPKRGHEPVGPNWKKPSSFAQLPKVSGHPDNAWLMHERQDAKGKYYSWLFFSKMTGQYYRVNESGSGYSPMGIPHNPWASPVNVRVGSASIFSDEGNKTKLDLTVLLPDLQKTGFLLKQPLEFLDKPASLFVLCAGLRNTGAASEFCAKRLHTLLLPKLSSRASVWYDYELTELFSDTVNALDKLLLESPACFAGCSIAVALLAGCRLVVGSMGSLRCLLCRPGVAKASTASARSSAPAPWVARPVGGSRAKIANQPESEEDKVYGGSACTEALEAITDDWEREALRVTRAVNSFAVLGVGSEDLQAVSKSVRSIFRRRSLILHPDKVGEERRQRTTALFSKIETAVDVVDSMLQTDSAATDLLAQIHTTHDEGRLAADPSVAAKLLGVVEGCGAAKAKKAAKDKFDVPLSRLQSVAREDVERAMKILDIACDTVARATQLWTPAVADVGVCVRHALGCKDLKVPAPLLDSKFSVEILQLALGEAAGLVFVADSAASLTDSEIARRLSEHSPGRPRAAALRVALDAAEAAMQSEKPEREMTSVVCAFFNDETLIGGSSDSMVPKRAKIGKPDRVRVSHVLLRWAGLKGADDYVRPGFPPPTRTQAEAERHLLELAEELLKPRDPKTLGARFKGWVLTMSECSTALNVPHADLGWVDPGVYEQTLEIAAFDTPVGGLSDVLVTTRGAHLMYRLA